MVNLIAGQRVVRELIHDACTPEAIADEAVRLLTEQDFRERMIASLEEVRRMAALGRCAKPRQVVPTAPSTRLRNAAASIAG